MRKLSLTARISLLFALAAAAVLLVTGYGLSRAVETHFVEGDRHELDGKLELIRNLLARADSPAAFDHLPQQLDDALVGHHGLAVAVMDAGGRIWFASSGADFPRALLSGRRCAEAGPDVRCLSDFSSDIAHELRTPIANLMTQTQVALSGARDNAAYREILYSSLEEYERMAQMVGDMLYLAQADNGLMRLARENVDLAAEARGLMDFFGAWAEERGVALRLEGNASVAGDRLMLRRALSNLVANAVRHAPPGSSVDIRLESRSGWTLVSVANPGEDIPAEHLPRLFDRFYRVDPARQRKGEGKGEGSGLGLAIVKAIAQAHGGRIDVTSAGGRTTFTLTLPAG